MQPTSPKIGGGYHAAHVENASSGAAICAERAAIAKAVSEGEMEFEVLAVVADVEEPVAPCGICRQNLIEFGDEIKVDHGKHPRGRRDRDGGGAIAAGVYGESFWD